MLDPAVLRWALSTAADHGIGRREALRTIEVAGAEESCVLDALVRANWALEECSVPASTWGPMLEVLGAELLGDVVGVSESSMRRYAAATRATPDDVAMRLHTVALIVADLAGSYNDFGIRRWFHRSRAELDGRAPLQVLHGDWDPDAPGPAAVRALAARLVETMAT